MLSQIHFPLTKFLTSAVGRCLFPLAIYGEGVADRPGVRSSPSQNPLRPQHGRLFPPHQISHICRRQMSIPLAKYLTSAVGRCLFPLAIYGEGVADRPGGEVWGTGLDDKRRQMRIHFLYRIKNNISTKHPTLSS